MKTCVPEAACWSESALPPSSPTTSPRLFSSVCSASPPLCSSPGTSAGAHPGPRPPPACAVLHWGAATATSAWAASAATRATSETWLGRGGEGGGLVTLRANIETHLESSLATCLLHQPSIYLSTSRANSTSGNVRAKQHLAGPAGPRGAGPWASGATGVEE